ncbi:hypothetical protein RHMOL_Rhmol02G0238600 [Rhododendron molle]|uniref:Uncharacterized protein n=1 Tax=Rhododendron molle TaxID=49168 RepID=A0ACC0PTA5_RHOML|nr:hypothetical protein RHMOL_Rhmol02G0238600 [Rhododendron molle]
MEDEADNYIFGTQEQQQDRIAEELQNNIREGITLGIKFDDMGVKRMKKMIEKEAIEMNLLLKNNTFALLQRN